MAVEVLVTGGDTELGRAVAEGFRDAGHTITLVGARRDDLEVAAKELDVDAIVCDTTDAASLAEVRHLFPHHLDTIVNVPAPRWTTHAPACSKLPMCGSETTAPRPAFRFANSSASPSGLMCIPVTSRSTGVTCSRNTSSQYRA